MSDAEALFTIRTDETINRYIYRTVAKEIGEIEAFIDRITRSIAKNESIVWGITSKETDVIIGTIVYWHIDKEKHEAETGYELLPKYHGQGMMQEALSAILQYGKEEIDLHHVCAYTHRDNTPSLNLLQRNGFARDSMLEQQYVGKTEPLTTVIYTLNLNK